MIDTDKYLDIPFSEADCYEFGSILYQDAFGYPLPSFNYELDSMKSMILAVMKGDDTFERIEKEDLQELDGIVFSSPECGRHIGFYIGGGKFIHMVKDSYPAVERLSSGLWSKRIMGYYRYVKRIQ